MSHVGDKGVVIPRLPRLSTGQEIDPHYVNQIISALESAIDILNSVRQRTFTEINLTNLQSHGAGLRDGDVFEDSGTLKIVRTRFAYAATLSAAGAVGTVTVSTP